MNKKLIKEHIDRQGIVNKQEFILQAGAAASLLWEPTVRLIEEKEVLYCRLDHGAETLLSRHLFLCLHAIRMLPELSCHAQEMYDWLCDNETARTSEMEAFSDEVTGGGLFWEALHELEREALVLPIHIFGANARQADIRTKSADELYELIWVTDEYWVQGVARSARYHDLEYDIFEVKRLLKNHYSTREMEMLLYSHE